MVKEERIDTYSKQFISPEDRHLNHLREQCLRNPCFHPLTTTGV